MLGCRLLPFAIKVDKVDAVHEIGHCFAGCRFTRVVGSSEERGCDRLLQLLQLLTMMNQAMEIPEDRLSVAVAHTVQYADAAG